MGFQRLFLGEQWNLYHSRRTRKNVLYESLAEPFGNLFKNTIDEISYGRLSKC